MDIAAYFAAEFDEHREVIDRSQAALASAFGNLVEVATTSIRRGGKLLFFGNGGSAADAQHLATELTIRYKLNRPAIAAIALTTDSQVRARTSSLRCAKRRPWAS